MMFATPCEEYVPDPAIAKALDLLLILHADHEQNCSTSTVRLVGSSRANLFASIAAGISALWGPLHGGANQSVQEMLSEIHRTGGDVEAFVRKVKNKEDGVRLMGFGHRVYKNYDPRAKLIKRLADQVFAVTRPNPLLPIALELERIALQDDYFVSRKLYPNVDFYSGLIYQAMGFPVDMFPVLFAIPRTSGWLAQWLEMVADPEQKIARPRQLYLGAERRDFVRLARREPDEKVD
jgi:citrate synthase